MKTRLLFVALSLMALSLTPANAASVSLPSSLTGASNNGGVQVSGEGEWFSRKLNPGKKDKISGSDYMVKASVPLNYMGQWDWYGEFGTMVNTTAKADVNGSTTRFELKDGSSMLGGVGVTWTPIVMPSLHDLSIFTDVKYRQMFNSDYDKVKVNDTESDFSSGTTPQFKEWQAAVGVAARFMDAFVPYVGATYSDVRVKTDTTIGGTDFGIKNESSRNKAGGVLGLTFNPGAMAPALKNLSFDAQARFGDENAYIGQITWKF